MKIINYMINADNFILSSVIMYPDKSMINPGTHIKIKFKKSSKKVTHPLVFDLTK